MVIGEFEIIDILIDVCLSRLFLNCVVVCYLVFYDFYGMEDVIE